MRSAHERQNPVKYPWYSCRFLLLVSILFATSHPANASLSKYEIKGIDGIFSYWMGCRGPQRVSEPFPAIHKKASLGNSMAAEPEKPLENACSPGARLQRSRGIGASSRHYKTGNMGKLDPPTKRRSDGVLDHPIAPNTHQSSPIWGVGKLEPKGKGIVVFSLPQEDKYPFPGFSVPESQNNTKEI